jgi:imidazolonepropionase
LKELLIKNASQVVTCDPALFDARDETGLAVGLAEGCDIAISDGLIRSVGRAGKAPVEGVPEIDATGMLVLPGLVDGHTHAVFAGSREGEFDLRIRGVPYMEIARRGGGINSTVEAVRRASRQDLVDAALPRLRSVLRTGTTTIEIKSGYGLDTPNEIKMLRAIRDLAGMQPVEIVPTFLGAHEFPPEYRNARGRYVSVVLEEMIPAVAEEGLAEFCDVFCEQGVFTVKEALSILQRGREAGLKPMIHADEFADSGAAALPPRSVP